MPEGNDKTTLNAILEKLERIESVSYQRADFEATLRNMYDQLYTEMADYKEDFLAQHFHKPLIKDLLLLYDNLENRLNRAIQPETADALENVQTDLLNILMRLDVEPMEPPQTKKTVLDLTRHKIIRVEETSKQKEDQQVVEVLKKGFLWKGKVFRAEHVAIKQYKKK